MKLVWTMSSAVAAVALLTSGAASASQRPPAGTGDTTASSAACPITVRPVPTPNANSGLTGLAGTSATNVWAVGESFPLSSLTATSPPIEHWNGTSWQSVPAAASMAHDALFAVSVDAANDVWADGSGNDGDVLDHWNGSHWARMAFPNGFFSAGPDAISADRPNDVWLVGNNLDPPTQATYPFLLHWNGHSWANRTPPGLQRGNAILQSVRALSPTNVTVGGWSGSNTLVTRYDGHGWSKLPNQGLANFGSAILSGPPAAGLWALGAQRVGHFGSGRWQLLPTLPGPQSSNFGSISAPAANSIWVGGTEMTATTNLPLLSHWNGSKWARPQLPSGSVGSISGVLVEGTHLWAVGGTYAYLPFGNGNALIYSGCAS